MERVTVQLVHSLKRANEPKSALNGERWIEHRKSAQSESTLESMCIVLRSRTLSAG